jgi:hypothetical protein
MRPGEGVDGSLTIGNDGDRPGRFTVRAAGVVDGGPTGAGKLSERVELAVFDVTNAPIKLHAGSPASFGQLDLGVIAPGGKRDYLVVATLPSGPTTASRGRRSASASSGRPSRSSSQRRRRPRRR